MLARSLVDSHNDLSLDDLEGDPGNGGESGKFVRMASRNALGRPPTIQSSSSFVPIPEGGSSRAKNFGSCSLPCLDSYGRISATQRMEEEAATMSGEGKVHTFCYIEVSPVSSSHVIPRPGQGTTHCGFPFLAFGRPQNP
jgi:hypothetical protein